jgi:hypothetical protein
MSRDKEILKAVYTTAEHVTHAGDCDDCGFPDLYFFTLGKELVIRENGFVDGGFYCANCGFGNAGAYPLELVAND